MSYSAWLLSFLSQCVYPSACALHVLSIQMKTIYLHNLYPPQGIGRECEVLHSRAPNWFNFITEFILCRLADVLFLDFHLELWRRRRLSVSLSRQARHGVEAVGGMGEGGLHVGRSVRPAPDTSQAYEAVRWVCTTSTGEAMGGQGLTLSLAFFFFLLSLG